MVGRDLYRNSKFDYRYSPLFAAALGPMSMLPLKVGSIVWRLVTVSVLLGALYRASRRNIPKALNAAESALMFLLLLPLALGNLNNGQANLLVLGLLTVSIVAVIRERWMLAAISVMLAGAIKIYPLVFCLPLVVVYPRQLLWRFVLCIVAVIALPFALQQPDYVARQYSYWFQYLRTEDRSLRPITEWYSDIRMLFRVWSVPLSSRAFVIMQIFSGTLVIICAWIGKVLDSPKERFIAWVFSLSCCWMVLFGPATESSTYVLIAVATAWAVTELLRGTRRPSDIAWIFVIYGLQLLPQMAAWFGGMKRFHIYTSLYTLSALSLGAYLLRPTVFRELRIQPLESGGGD